MIKVLFIDAVDPFKEYSYPGLGLCYLVSSLRKAFAKHLFEFRIAFRNIRDELTEFKPNVVGISGLSANYDIARSYAAMAKRLSIPVIIGGSHITALPLTMTDDMDIGIVGEGEDTIVELFEVFVKKGIFETGEISQVKGLYYREDGILKFTGYRAPIEPLDRIPTPARDLIEIGERGHIITSRGCPYNCVFCASKKFWGRIRFSSPGYVVSEISELIEKYKVRHIDFMDDLFIADYKRLSQIADLIISERLHKRVTFGVAGARAALLTEQTIKILKNMNVMAIGVGFESGSERILKFLKGKQASIKQNINAANAMKKYEIPVGGYFVIGSPDETEVEILETLRFVKRFTNTNFTIQILTPLPGTLLWDYAKAKGIISDSDMDWSILNTNFSENYKKVPILSGTLSREQLIELFKKFKQVSKKKYWTRITSLFVKNPFRGFFLLRMIIKEGYFVRYIKQVLFG